MGKRMRDDEEMPAWAQAVLVLVVLLALGVRW